MNRLHWIACALLLAGCAQQGGTGDTLRGTGDMGVIVERAAGRITDRKSVV